MDSSCFSFFVNMSVLTLALCARLSWLLNSFYVHIILLHIIIIVLALWAAVSFGAVTGLA